MEEHLIGLNTNIFYQGQPLETLDIYEVSIYSASNVPIRFYLEILDNDSRYQISSDLKILAEELQDADAETISQARARYFMENNLWSDALPEIFLASRSQNTLNALMYCGACIVQRQKAWCRKSCLGKNPSNE